MQKALGTKLKMSTAFHPMTDGQTERTIQTLEDLLRACVLEFQGGWEDKLPLIEFSYNNSHHASIGMTPFEALYGRKCQTPFKWSDSSERIVLGSDMIEDMIDQVRIIRAKMKVAEDRQKSYADKRRRDLEFDEGDWVLLKVSPTKGVKRFGRKVKLSSRYIGPYQITRRIGKVAYQLALPNELERYHDAFHVSQLRKCLADPTLIVDVEEVPLEDDLTYEEYLIQILDSKVRKTRNCEVMLVVQWSRHGALKATWETLQDMEATYPHLFGEYATFNFFSLIAVR